MSFKSQSVAKALLAAFLAIGSTSAYLAHGWSGELVSAKSSLQTAERAARTAERAFKELDDVLTPDAQEKSLEDAFSELVLALYNQRLAYGITVATATPTAVSTGSRAAEIDTLADAVPGTSIKSVRLNVRGSYTDYLGLLGYLKVLQQAPVSIVHLKVQGQNFDLGLRVYGRISQS